MFKGIIKSVPVTTEQATEGMQVLHKGNIDMITLIVRTGCWLKEAKYRTDGVSELNTLVVEYYKERYDENDNPAFKHSYQLPLKLSQWQLAIDLGYVDSGESIDFKFSKSITTKIIVNQEYPDKTIDVAEIIDKKQKLYTEEQMLEGIMAGLQFIAVDPNRYKEDALEILKTIK